MKKLFAILSGLIAAFSLISLFENLSTVISVSNWEKTEAVISAILLPDGVVCGDFTDNNGVKHIEQPLYTDFKFQQIRAIKTVKQETIDKSIGQKITILYNNENYKIIIYSSLLRKITISSIVSLLSLLIFLSLVLHKKRPDQTSAADN